MPEGQGFMPAFYDSNIVRGWRSLRGGALVSEAQFNVADLRCAPAVVAGEFRTMTFART
jgi:hypothetical protein